MKKIFHIAITIMLVLATTGVSISKHYCHGSLISSSLFVKAKTCCNSNCKACHNETTLARVTDNFVSSTLSLEKAKELKLNFPILSACLLHRLSVPEISLLQNTVHKILPPNIRYSALPEYLEVFRC